MFMFPTPSILKGTILSVAAGLRPQDVFATSLYTGTGAAQTITNGLALAGKGGLVWVKSRQTTSFPGHVLNDTARGAGNWLGTETTNPEATPGNIFSSFNSNGFTLGPSGRVNANGFLYTAWSWVRAAKFFDIVPYTGDGTSGRQIPHGLGIAPGMIVVKARTGPTSQWVVQHRSLSPQGYLYLEKTDGYAAGPYAGYWQNTVASATTFTVGNDSYVNTSGTQYVAYLFAHDPDTTNGIVQCGSITLDANGLGTVNLGWRPQWLLFKSASSAQDWCMFDTARGWNSSNANILNPNSSGAESSPGASTFLVPTATGFQFVNGNYFGSNTQLVFTAIRAPT